MIKITSRNFVIQAVDQIGNLHKFAIFEFMAAVGKQTVLENKLNFPPRYYMAVISLPKGNSGLAVANLAICFL